MVLFLVSDITNSTLNITLNTYSLQDALTPNCADSTAYTNGYIAPYLFHTGCQYNGDITQLAQSLGIEKAQWPSTVSLNITMTIGSCLDAYCDSLPGCNYDLQSYNESAFASESTFRNFTGSFYFDTDYYSTGTSFDLCVYYSASVNQDIGGIGVCVSYWIQTGIGLLAFLMVVWWKRAAYYFSLGIFALSPKANRQARAQRIRIKGRTVRLDALTSALAEFHKAQCFFVLAINIAAQVDRAKGGLQPQSLQQLYNTWVLIKSISIGGYLLVTFTLFTLHLVNLVSWYLLSLTICTVAVSIATLITIGNFNPSDADISYLSQASSTNGPPACGERTPGAWCYIPNYMYYTNDPSNGAYSMLGFCAFILFLLMAKQLGADSYLSKLASQRKILEHRKTKQLRRSFSYHILSWKPLSRQMLSWRVLSWTQSEGFTRVAESTNKDLRLRGILAKEAIIKVFRSTDWRKASKSAFIVLFYATITGFYVQFFLMFCQDLAWFATHGISNSWSFGQIVAITVWAEPLCEYLHLEIRGIRRGFDHRLPAPYKVVKGEVKGKESTSEEKGADKDKAESGEELAVLPTANSSPVQPYQRSPTNNVYEKVRDLEPLETKRLVETSDSTHSGYDQVEHQEDFTPLEVNFPEEEDITWQMSDFSSPERVPLSYS
ncbi:hypothetical protein JMJ35_009228 [Cladonia borealis]|uniref:Uncharacterized protein n=1 Tax=Cladonia borealis TaxID=184061 RepID=A0AA39QUG7_9LECA|nr:hypothetical protein JMJ35_009228 [Cladonia borealis]